MTATLTSDYINCPSGLILPEHAAIARYASARRPKGVDLFAGCGGMSLGIIQAGFEVVAMSEFDCSATMTYMVNLCRYGEVKVHMVTDADGQRFEKFMTQQFKQAGLTVKDGEVQVNGRLDVRPVPMAGSGWISNQPASTPGVKHIFFGDCRKLSAERILDEIGMKRGELDLVCGGPPCQGYSWAGKRNVYDARNSLVFEFARFITDLSPKAMVMEEVTGILDMVTPDGNLVIDQLIRILEDGGFGGYNALKKAIDAQAGSVGLLRGNGTRRDVERREKKATPAPSPQSDLFAEAQT